MVNDEKNRIGGICIKRAPLRSEHSQHPGLIPELKVSLIMVTSDTSLQIQSVSDSKGEDTTLLKYVAIEMNLFLK